MSIVPEESSLLSNGQTSNQQNQTLPRNQTLTNGSHHFHGKDSTAKSPTVTRTASTLARICTVGTISTGTSTEHLSPTKDQSHATLISSNEQQLTGHGTKSRTHSTSMNSQRSSAFTEENQYASMTLPKHFKTSNSRSGNTNMPEASTRVITNGW